MRAQALFLVSLFLLIIAFPGYGRSANNLPVHQMVQIHDTPLTLLQLLQRCLQTGIKLNKEEHEQQEEGDDASSSCFLIEETTILRQQQCACKSYYVLLMPQLNEVTLCTKYPPPDCI